MNLLYILASLQVGYSRLKLHSVTVCMAQLMPFQLPMKNSSHPDISCDGSEVDLEEVWQSSFDCFSDELSNEVNEYSNWGEDLGEYESDEDRVNLTKLKDSSFSQSDALERIFTMLKFAEDAGLDGSSARIALTESMGDEDRLQTNQTLRSNVGI